MSYFTRKNRFLQLLQKHAEHDQSDHGNRGGSRIEVLEPHPDNRSKWVDAMMVRAGGTEKQKEAAKQFLTRFTQSTWGNPLNPRERGIGGQTAKEPLGLIELYPSGDGIHIAAISSHPPKQGMGTKMMKLLTDLADEAGVTLDLSPHKFGNMKGSMNDKQLRNWYPKLGFGGKFSEYKRLPQKVVKP